jgi:hypothetical protein
MLRTQLYQGFGHTVVLRTRFAKTIGMAIVNADGYHLGIRPKLDKRTLCAQPGASRADLFRTQRIWSQQAKRIRALMAQAAPS